MRLNAVEENDGLGMEDAVTDCVALSFGLRFAELSLVLVGMKCDYSYFTFSNLKVEMV